MYLNNNMELIVLQYIHCYMWGAEGGAIFFYMWECYLFSRDSLTSLANRHVCLYHVCLYQDS